MWLSLSAPLPCQKPEFSPSSGGAVAKLEPESVKLKINRHSVSSTDSVVLTSKDVGGAAKHALPQEDKTQE